MSSMNYLKLMVLACLMASSISSCEYKSLEEISYCSQSVLLDFDWSSVGERAKSFNVVFYPADDETAAKLSNGYISYGTYNAQSILNYLPNGRFNITAWSTDCEYNKVIRIPYREEVAATLAASYPDSTLPSSVIDSLYSKQTVYATPDYILKAKAEDVTIEKGIERQRLILKPDCAILSVRIEIHGIKGLSVAKQIRGTLNNVAKERLMSFERVTKDTAMVMVDFNFNREDSLVWSDFYLYDIEPSYIPTSKASSGASFPHLLTLFFWLEGNNIFLPIDVTNEVGNFVNGNDNKIVLSIDNVNLDLTEYLPGMGGFDVDVDDWEDVLIDVPF